MTFQKATTSMPNISPATRIGGPTHDMPSTKGAEPNWAELRRVIETSGVAESKTNKASFE